MRRGKTDRRNFQAPRLSVSVMSSALVQDDDYFYQVVRSQLTREQALFCQLRLASENVDCVIGCTDASGAAPTTRLEAERWWLKVAWHHQNAAGELITSLERAPVRLVRHDATWKWACAASVLPMPVNYFLIQANFVSSLTVALTTLLVVLAALYGHQCATYICSDPQCRAANDPAAEWCCRCGARIGDGVDREW